MRRLEGADDEQVCERLAAEEWISEDSVEDLALSIEKEELLLAAIRAVQEAIEKITDEGQLWRLL